MQRIGVVIERMEYSAGMSTSSAGAKAVWVESDLWQQGKWMWCRNRERCMQYIPAPLIGTRYVVLRKQEHRYYHSCAAMGVMEQLLGQSFSTRRLRRASLVAGCVKDILSWLPKSAEGRTEHALDDALGWYERTESHRG